MKTTEKKKKQRISLFRRQRGHCVWCKRKMILPEKYPQKGEKPHPRLCTIEHLDDRFSDDRGAYQGQYRRVAACWECNNNRSAMQQANMPIEELRKRATH